MAPDGTENRRDRRGSPVGTRVIEAARIHGEYKTPGGKLVAVDLDVVEDRLAKVMVSGDFFLYPEEALAEITGALEGQPADLTESEYAELVRFAMPRGTELLGSSPEAIAAALGRALRSEREDGAEEGQA